MTKRASIFWQLFVCSILLFPPIPFNHYIGIPHIDKVEHFILFASIMYFASRSMTHLWTAMIYTAGLGIMTEIIQHFISWRHGSVGDLIADFSGAGITYVVLKILSYYNQMVNAVFTFREYIDE